MDLAMDTEETDEQAELQKIIQELEELALHGRGMETAQRMGKLPAPGADPAMDPMAAAGAGDDAGSDLAAMDSAPVPGAEPDLGDEEQPASSGPNPDKMRALLAKLKSTG